MIRKKRIIVIILFMVLVLVGISVSKYFNQSKNDYLIEKEAFYNEEAIFSDALEEDLDSIFHKQISSDYNVVWEEFDVKKSKVKVLEFNVFSGKILVRYLNNTYDKNLELLKIPADAVFGWDFYKKQNDFNKKIIGTKMYTEKDTIMEWTFDEDKQILTDEKGVVFKKVTLKK